MGHADAQPATPPEELLDYYKKMLFIRRFEEKAGQLYGMGLIGGFCHLYIGQEAIVVGLEASAVEGDRRITAYRSHAHMIASGMHPNRIMAELAGRSSGYSHGKGGSMHMFGPEQRFYGGHGLVGANVPIGIGLALADKYRSADHVTFNYFGDGAADQGQVYESFSLAARFSLPVVFVIENNSENAQPPHAARNSSQKPLYQRAEAFGIPGEGVDGMDVIAVRDAGRRARAHCAKGKGPYLLEMKTYRYRGHAMADTAKYRTLEEAKKVRAKQDPVALVRERVLHAKYADEAALREIDEDIRTRVKASADFARKSAEPSEDSLLTDVYAREGQL